MPRILPALEAYQANLEERARSWDERSDAELDRDLAQCESQVRLLEKSLSEIAPAIEKIPADLPDELARAQHRVEVLTQTRDLTGAYLHVLRAYRQRRGRA
jgi:hypothetical protein